MLFEVSTWDNGMDIGAVEACYSWRNKKFILRDTILGDGIHFTTVLQMPHGWMHFGDMMHPKFLLFDQDESEAAMMGQEINFLAFEVVSDTETKQFGNENHEWMETFTGTVSRSARAAF